MNARAGPPNVLFIMVDDLRPQLGCYGWPQIQTPHLDALARRGAVFERHYCQQAICGPSRANVFTGQRPDTLGIYTLKQKVCHAAPDVVTMPQHFRAHRYETLALGKTYHGRNEDPKGWTRQLDNAPHRERATHYVNYEAAYQIDPLLGNGRGPAFEAGDVDDDAYRDGANTTATIELLRQRRHAEQPFFLALGYFRPHLPFTAPKAYWDRYAPGKITIADNPFPPQGVHDHSLTNFDELRSYRDLPNEGAIPEALARQLVHGYYACVIYIDAQVGRLLAALDELKLHDNTVVVFCTDHSFKLGEHGAWSKHCLFEADTHIPLIIRSPGKAGMRTRALSENVDIFPTLCDLAGLPTPWGVEGVSLCPLIDQPNRPWKTAAFSQYPRTVPASSEAPHREFMGRAIRTDRFRYVEWQRMDTGEATARELYDHVTDPGENTNVVDQPTYAEHASRSAQQLHAGWRSARPQRMVKR